MIHINANRKDGKIVYLSVKGHAKYASKGEDIVCAAISAISIGGINALQNPKSFKLTVKEADVEIEQIDVAKSDDYIVLETLLTQLKTVMEAYPSRIKVIEKGN